MALYRSHSALPFQWMDVGATWLRRHRCLIFPTWDVASVIRRTSLPASGRAHTPCEKWKDSSLTSRPGRRGREREGVRHPSPRQQGAMWRSPSRYHKRMLFNNDGGQLRPRLFHCTTNEWETIPRCMLRPQHNHAHTPYIRTPGTAIGSILQLAFPQRGTLGPELSVIDNLEFLPYTIYDQLKVLNSLLFFWWLWEIWPPKKHHHYHVWFFGIFYSILPLLFMSFQPLIPFFWLPNIGSFFKNTPGRPVEDIGAVQTMDD